MVFSAGWRKCSLLVDAEFVPARIFGVVQNFSVKIHLCEGVKTRFGSAVMLLAHQVGALFELPESGKVIRHANSGNQRFYTGQTGGFNME